MERLQHFIGLWKGAALTLAAAACLFLLLAENASNAPRSEPATVPAPVKEFLGKNCVVCHRTANAPAGLDLSSLDFDLENPETFSRWVRVHDAVDRGAMPPAAPPHLSPALRAAFTDAVAAPLRDFEKKRAATAGRAVLRRLNRYEYENSVRDLLAAPWLQLRNSLPEDGIVQRLNKSGQALDVSHVQMARYMETAEQALRLVLAAALEPESKQRFYARDQQRFLNRMRYSSFNRHPERATIPILGFDAQPDVLAERVPITVGDSDPAVRELEGFGTPASTYVGNEYHFDGFTAKVGGRYRLRFNAFSIWIHTVYTPIRREGKEVMWWRPNREKTERGRTTEPLTIYAFRRGGEKRLLGTFDVGPEPAIHELDAYLLPGEQILPDAARLFRSRPGFIGSPDASEAGMPGVAYRWMEVAGPVREARTVSEARALNGGLTRLFGTQKVTRDADGHIVVSSGNLEQLLRSFMTGAYRRPPEEAEVQRYLKFAKARLGASPDFAEAMLAAYTAVLCSPGFLYLRETPGELDDYALAARLSYFLWNAPPDAELRALAAKGALRDAETLRAQTDRLLDAARSRHFVNALLDYWLDLRKLSDTTPDQTLYPEYYLDDLLVESALSETQMFVDHLIRRNLPAAYLADSTFTFVNAHLARHYDLPPVEGSAMRLVELPASSPRGGLLTQASVLKVTANGTTTSPVLRGVWILERVLGDPPPPPPPGTPAVEPDTRGATTIRQQLDKHRSIASCAVCHKKIDPPGFALESFDVLGKWRERYRSIEEGEAVELIGKNGHPATFRLALPVDSTGQLATGEPFEDISQFKKLLLRDERQLARSVVKQLVAYSTGAPVSFADRAELERILDAAKPGHYGMRALIHEVVQSQMFRNK